MKVKKCQKNVEFSLEKHKD